VPFTGVQVCLTAPSRISRAMISMIVLIDVSLFAEIGDF